MSGPAEYDFTIERGGTRPIAVTLWSIVNSVRSVLPFTSARLEVKLDGETLFDKTPEGPGFTASPSTGVVRWVPTREETLAIPLGRRASFALWVTLTDGTETRYLKGYMIGDD